MDPEEVGAHPSTSPAGEHQVRLGIYLPGITPDEGFRLVARIIHTQDQFDREIPPVEADLEYSSDRPQLGLWSATVPLRPPKRSGTVAPARA